MILTLGIYNIVITFFPVLSNFSYLSADSVEATTHVRFVTNRDESIFCAVKQAEVFSNLLKHSKKNFYTVEIFQQKFFFHERKRVWKNYVKHLQRKLARAVSRDHYTPVPEDFQDEKRNELLRAFLGRNLIELPVLTHMQHFCKAVSTNFVIYLYFLILYEVLLGFYIFTLTLVLYILLTIVIEINFNKERIKEVNQLSSRNVVTVRTRTEQPRAEEAPEQYSYFSSGHLQRANAKKKPLQEKKSLFDEKPGSV